jgi:hypothetical protein
MEELVEVLEEVLVVKAETEETDTLAAEEAEAALL